MTATDSERAAAAGGLVRPAAELAAVAVRHGPVTALDGVTLSVAPGERVALVGPSGSGKTTVLEVLAGLTAPTEGSVRALGTDLGRLSGRAGRRHRSRVGVVGQHLDLALGLRVVHNVNAGRLGTWGTAPALASLVRPAGRGQVVDVLDAVGLAERIDARTGDLSGGERQRVAVARVLRQRPELVLADEPTSSVDPRLADIVLGLLCPDPPDGARWTTVVSVHDPDLAQRHADRLVGLRNGRIVFDRPAAEVADRDLSALYRGAEGDRSLVR